MTTVEELQDLSSAAIRRVPAECLKTLIRDLKKHRWTVVQIDWTHRLPSKGEILERLSEGLQSPYGIVTNWDALSDVLGDLTNLEASGVLIVLEGVALDETADLRVLKELLEEASAFNAKWNTPFKTVLVEKPTRPS